MNNKIDHFAIGANNLEQGISFLQEKLGVEIPRGGKHPAMSTHNCLAQSGNSSFIELISIDPEAPDPDRVRWFTLDDANTQARVAESPKALCWVVNTDDLDAVIAASPVDLGEVLELSRGDLSWKLTVPKDGSLVEGGLLPAFIEWSRKPHPSSGMQDIGVELKTVRLTHPDPEKLTAMLTALSVEHLVEVVAGKEAGLSFDVQKPDGEIVEIH